MHKQIILFRHAQSAGKQAGQHDYDRSLTSEGEAQARKAGHEIIRNSLQPDILISSGALRARATSLLINESTQLSRDQLVFMDTLYETDGDTWLLQLKQLEDRYNTVICVGHNPTLSWLASHLSGRQIDLAPAAWVAFRSSSVSWSSIDQELKEIPLRNFP